MGALVATDYKQPKQILEETKIVQIGIDKSFNDTKVIEYANCITAREDRGVSNRRSEGTAVLVKTNDPIHVADLCSEKYNHMHEISRRVYDENGISPTIHTCQGGNTEPKVARNKLRIVRKLTPKECHRLMGFDDADYEKCKAIGMSDSQGYKQAGNSIVVNVIELLMQHLYKAQYDSTYVCDDEKF